MISGVGMIVKINIANVGCKPEVRPLLVWVNNDARCDIAGSAAPRIVEVSNGGRSGRVEPIRKTSSAIGTKSGTCVDLRV